MSDEKGFRIVDDKKGTFELFDKAFGVYRLWKVDDDATPGTWILQEKLDKQLSQINSFLPRDKDLDKSERKKLVKKHLDSLSTEEKTEYYKKIQSVSNKQLNLMAGYVEPVDPPIEEGLFCGIWETKIEFLASCLSREDDTAKINTFFLTHLSDTTKSQEPKEAGKKSKS